MFENIINICILHDIFLAQQNWTDNWIDKNSSFFLTFSGKDPSHQNSPSYILFLFKFFHCMLYNLHCIFQICRYNFTLIDNFDITDWIWLKSWRMTYPVRGYQGHAGTKYKVSLKPIFSCELLLNWVTWPVEYLSMYLFNILLSLWRKFPHRYCLFKCHA